MNLQNAVLNRYRETFPNDTLREISEKTSIQLTRVFRILNGSEMKLKEYEKFENALKVANSNFATGEFFELTKLSLEKLSTHKLDIIIAQMKQSLKINSLKNKNIYYLKQRKLA